MMIFYVTDHVTFGILNGCTSRGSVVPTGAYGGCPGSTFPITLFASISAESQVM
ncbi:MAG: hypothetical protein ACLUDU_07855 [Butyricimonas faecihominis]